MAGTRHPRPAPLGPPPGRCPGQDRRPGVGSPGAVSKASVSVSRDPGPPSSPNTALGVDAPHGTANSAPAGCAVVVSSAWQGRGQGDPGARIGWPEAGLRAGIASGPLPATTPSAAAPRTHRALLPPRGRQRHHMPVGGRSLFPDLGPGQAGPRACLAPPGAAVQVQPGVQSWAQSVDGSGSRSLPTPFKCRWPLGSLEQPCREGRTGCQAHLGALGTCRCVCSPDSSKASLA